MKIRLPITAINKDTKRAIQNVNSEELPDVTMEEFENALRQIKTNKAPGELLPEMLIKSDQSVKEELRKLFAGCLIEEEIAKTGKTQ